MKLNGMGYLFNDLGFERLANHGSYDWSLPAQPMRTRKSQSRKKKSHIPLRISCISQTNVSAMFYNHRVSVILTINKLFAVSLL